MPLRAKLSLIVCAALPLLLVLSVCAPTRSRAVRNGKAVCDPLLQAIESHRSGLGAYPASLDELVAAKKSPTAPAVPSYWNMLERPLTYSASHDGSVFCMTFAYTGVFDGHATRVYYLSTNGTWLDKPYEPPDVNWEAALVHGQEYQATRSGEALRRAVVSLTQAPDEWLFVFGVEPVLGNGNGAPVDDATEYNELRYHGSDGSTQVFVLDGGLLREIYTVKRDECGNEKPIVVKKYQYPRSGR